MADIVFIVDEAENLVTAFLLHVEEIYQTWCAPKNEFKYFNSATVW